MANTTEGSNAMVLGRIVWVTGTSLFKGEQKKDQNTRAPLFNTDGSPKMQFGFGLAVKKSELNGPNGQIFQVMQNEAKKLYPTNYPPAFAWKFKDGDGVDHEGKPFADREGHAGHLILACTTSLPIKFFRYNEQLQKHEQIEEGIKCGDYVQVQVNVVAHPPIGQGKAGLYLNPTAVLFVGYGKEIVSTRVNAENIFGKTAPALPEGASSSPLAPTTGFPGMPGQAAAPAPQAMPQQPPAYQPHPGVLPQQFQQQAAPPMPQAMPQQPPIPQQAPAPQGIPGLPPGMG